MNSPMIFLLITFFSALEVAQADTLFRGSAMVDLLVERSIPYAINEIFELEGAMGTYMLEVLQRSATEENASVYTVDVHVKEQAAVQSDSSTSIAIDTELSIVYLVETDSVRKPAEPIDMVQILNANVDPNELADILNVNGVVILYGNQDEDTEQLLDKIRVDEPNRTKADRGLIAATAFLSFALLMISTVVLYITGGCAACRRCLVNICFEEVEDDDIVVTKRDTFPVQSMDQDEMSVPASVQSAADTSVAPSLINASGILGAASNDENDPKGSVDLGGIQTPVRGNVPNTSTADLADSSVMETPMSEITAASNNGALPLGITSMRKLKVEDATGDPLAIPGDENGGSMSNGLAHMILGRLNFENEK